jgi:hypothetical protein
MEILYAAGSSFAHSTFFESTYIDNNGGVYVNLVKVRVKFKMAVKNLGVSQ